MAKFLAALPPRMDNSRPMFTREELITRINASLTWIEGYLKQNAPGNHNTSSLLAEDFFCRA